MTSRFLNIDLDFFLSGIANMPDGGRLSSEDYKPWSKQKVRNFLEGRCGLDRKSKIPGRFVSNHDAAFDYWEELRRQDGSLFPLELVHIDAHADLGLGDASWRHIMTDVLRRPVSERATAERGPRCLNLGSYIAYAVACRWIGSIEYVYPLGRGDDLPLLLFQDFSSESGALQLKCFEREALDVLKFGGELIEHLRGVHPVGVEPSVPFKAIQGAKWRALAPFDRALLCQSPDFTPETADALIGVFADYIDFR